MSESVKRVVRWSWLAPLLALSLLSLLLFTGASRRSSGTPQHWLIDSPPSSEDELQQALVEGPGGWNVPLASVRPRSQVHESPRDWSVSSTGVAIILPHFGDGAVGGLSLCTTLFLVNDLTRDISVQVEFHTDGDEPVTFAGTTGSTFPLTLKSREMKRLRTAGTGNLKSGWIHVHSDQPIAATVSFQFIQSDGTVVSDVGVAEGFPGTRFTLFADTIGAASTALAVVNPSDTQTISVQCELLRNSGATAGTAAISLPPRGHLARYLTEAALFRHVAGIDEFEGSVVLTSSQPFAGITLRTVGFQLTSVPLAPPAPPDSTRTNLALAQVANGRGDGLSYKTSVLLLNDTSKPATGKVEFFSSDATPMTVTIANTTAAAFDFNLAPRAVTRLQTDGAGPLKVGWARVTMDQPMSGAGIFHMFDPADNLIGEVGVEAAPLRRRFRFIADSIGNTDTGIALVNPNAAEDDATVNLTAYLDDNSGNNLAWANLRLDSMKHSAKFMTELFASAPEINIDEFEGIIRVESGGPLAQMSLRQVGVKLTSMPVWVRKYGFAPTSTVVFAQNLAGQSPAVEWTVGQDAEDYMIRQMRIHSPDLGFRTNTFQTGLEIGRGYIPLDSDTRVYSLVATKDGASEFMVVGQSGSDSAICGTGRFSGQEQSNLQLDLTMDAATDGAYNGRTYDLHFFIHAGIVNAPTSPSAANLTTTFTSVSSKRGGDVHYVRTATSPSSFVAADAARASAHRLSTLFLSPRATGAIVGANFGANPRVICPVVGGGTTDALVIETAADRVTFFVPENITDGQIQIDDGAGPGNALGCPVMFAPILALQPASRKGGTDTTLKFSFSQVTDEYALDHFQMDMKNVTAAFTSLAAGTIVGKGEIQGSSSRTLDVKVDAVTTDKLTLGLYKSKSSSLLMKLIVSKLSGGLSFEYSLDTPQTGPVVNSQAALLEIELTGLPIRLPPPGTLVGAMAGVFSCPTGSGGERSAALVNTVAVFTTE